MEARKTPRIAESEWQIMRVIWDGARALTASEIVDLLSAVRPNSECHPKTVRTLLSRLVKKAALSYEARGNMYFYSAKVSEAQCVAAASESFLERVFGGSVSPMLAYFVESRKITKTEKEELRRLLNDHL